MFHNISMTSIVVQPREQPAKMPKYTEKAPWVESKSNHGKVIYLWLHLFIDILEDDWLTKKLWNSLKTLTQIAGNEEEPLITNLLDINLKRVRRRRRMTGKEFRLDAQLDGYEVQEVMLDLGSDINILQKKSWEAVGKPSLVYSPRQLRMAN